MVKYINMKKRLFLITFVLAGIAPSGYTQSKSINSCFIEFNNGTNLRAGTPDKLPKASAKPRKVNTSDGVKSVSVTDGYRVLYLNEKNAPFVNLKVEKSAKKRYEKDQQILIDHLTYLNKNSTDMESKELLELEMNGYKIYGFSRASIDKGSTLGTFVLFPGDNTVVYFYFNNLKPEYRNFNTVESYKNQRDSFMELYTEHLKSCD